MTFQVKDKSYNFSLKSVNMARMRAGLSFSRRDRCFVNSDHSSSRLKQDREDDADSLGRRKREP